MPEFKSDSQEDCNRFVKIINILTSKLQRVIIVRNKTVEIL